jgi:predicted O-methyltransferase YrrM
MLSNPVLDEIFSSGYVRDPSGGQARETSGIRRDFAEALYRAVRRSMPRLVVEVGMAHGVSSLAILTALRDNGNGGRLISIDPFQRTDWRGIGLANVQQAGLADAHQLVEEPDYFALPDLLRRGTEVDFAYIDGWHTFDYTLLDFWYLDRMLPVGGIVVFNDCGLRAVHRVIRFVLSHRRYEEIDSGLAPDFRSGNPLGSVRRRLTGRNGADRYFRKTERWEPGWSFYAPF